MNAKTTHQKVRFGLECARLMTVRREKITTNVLVCAGIFVLGIIGNQYGLAIGAMAFVQSVNLSEMVQAYREAKKQPPIQYENPPEGRQ